MIQDILDGKYKKIDDAASEVIYLFKNYYRSTLSCPY
jgi:hypothetical protein